MINEIEKTSIKDFTNLYSLSKTLRFELIPQGKTLENIKKKGLLTQDENRANDYEKVKKIIDEYHKDFIEEALSNVKLKIDNDNNKNSLEEYYTIYNVRNRSEEEKKDLKKIQENLRKQITKKITEMPKYKRIFGKELIKKDLLNVVATEEDKILVNNFKNFTTYFTGFHENRKNMYTAEEHSTGIAYRIINENLPKFIDNLGSYEQIKNILKNEIEKLYTELKNDLFVKNIDEVFSLKLFAKFLSQRQIDTYNLVLGGKTLENGTKIKGLNEYVNLYNQIKTDKGLRLPKLKPLFKQILSDREAISWLPETFKDDNHLLSSIKDFYQNLQKIVLTNNKFEMTSLYQLLQRINEYNLSRIYLKNGLGLTSISQKMFENHDIFQQAVNADFEEHHPIKEKETLEKYIERKDKFFKSFDSFSIGYLQGCLSLIGYGEKKIIDYFKKLGETEEVVSRQTEENLFAQIDANYKAIKDLLDNSYPKDKKLTQDEINISKIKTFLDSIKSLQWFVKPLLGSGKESDKEDKFYPDFYRFIYGEELADKTKTTGLFDVNKLYDKVRNYMSKKPYTEEKYKLNFENSTLLEGWDVNKENANSSVILRKDGLFYLGIMDKKHNGIFKQDFLKSDDAYYEKMEYKLLPGVNKMIPKCSTQLKSVKNHFNILDTDFLLTTKAFIKGGIKISKRIFELNNRVYDKSTNSIVPKEKDDKRPKLFQKEYLTSSDNEIEYKKALFDWIEFCKDFLSVYKSTSIYTFNYNDHIFNSLDQFYNYISTVTYELQIKKRISQNEINQMIEEGKLYLFQIYNKDFSAYSKGTPNMHTLYWKMLFDENNLKNVVYKLNGQAEVFYRPASIKDAKITHAANEVIKNKNPLNEKTESKFTYNLIKDKRYTQDKFQFHVPITMNFKASGTESINSDVNRFIKKNADEINIIGVDRGERHLLYLSLIDSNGEIIAQYSLNEIVNEYNGQIYKTNYHNLLDKKEGERDYARKNWKTIENIKELKEGYLSQVIHKITELMVKNNAIVVLEDLSFGFMRGRQKVEKQVYQKFEKMLIDKLNYSVDKKKQPNDPCGTLNALQLTNKFENFKDIDKQNGFLFYVPAWNTSNIDPVTGFVNLFDTRYENMEKAKVFFEKFGNIEYNKTKNYFEFKVKDYTKFSNKAEDTRQDWTICTNSTRIITFRNSEKNSQWDSKEVTLTNEFTKLFKKYNINENYKEEILKQTSTEFFKELLHLFKLTVQMRNSKTGTNIDYLISPVADKNGVFYDSRDCENADNPLPKDADANGAYNIARKGLWILKQIQKAEDLKKLKLAITNKEWLQFAQNENSIKPN